VRPRAVVFGAIVVVAALVVAAAVSASLVIAGVIPRSVIEDLAYPPPTPLPVQPDCPVATEGEPLCIVVLGDSIAAGVPLDGEDRWWMRMQDALGAALPGRQVAVVSWAVPRGRVNVLESAATDQPALKSFDIAIVIEGVNDVGRTPVDEWSKRYQAAVERMEARGLDVVVAAPPANFEHDAQQHRHDAVDEAVRAMATAERPLLDIAARFQADGDEAAASYYSDNLHQREAGQQVIAEMATDAVLDLVGAR
jgi:lysophospholipase L1-like esterase